MDRKEFFKIIDYIVDSGVVLLEKYFPGNSFPVDYVAIFSRDIEEQEGLLAVVSNLGKVVETTETGSTYLLKESYLTRAGELRLVKVRKPDREKPYRGAPDFRVKDYQRFRERVLPLGCTCLIQRPEYEMIELGEKGSDVLVYFPNIPLSKDLGLTD